MNKLTIAYATNRYYLPLTLVSMVSVILNNPGVHFIILYTDLIKDDLLIVEDLVSKYSCTVEFKMVNIKEFEEFPLSPWVTVHAWFRIKLADWFLNLDRILYLDCDTLVLENLDFLWKTDLTNKYVAVVEDVWGSSKHCNRLKMKSKSYFNSGMILIACDIWRKNNLFEQMRKFCLESKENIIFCDQDTLNKVIDEDKVILDPKFNFMDTWWRHYHYDYVGEMEQAYLNAREAPIIVHYTGCKPWQKGCLNAYFTQWWDYAARTPVYSILKNKFLSSERFYKKRPFFRWLLSFHYTLRGRKKIPTFTFLGKEYYYG